MTTSQGKYWKPVLAGAATGLLAAWLDASSLSHEQRVNQYKAIIERAMSSGEHHSITLPVAKGPK